MTRSVVLALLVWGSLLHSQTTCVLAQSTLSFGQPLYSITIDESVTDDGVTTGLPADGFIIVRCTDTSGTVSSISYLIPSLGLPFGVHPLSGELFVPQNQTLSYEDQSSYSFPIECFDSINTEGENRATAMVQINLNDVNEFIPFFEGRVGGGLSLIAVISEDAAVGTTVIATGNPMYPEAMDGDGGPQGVVKYITTENNTDPFARFFAIDRTSGSVTIAREGIDLDAPNVNPFVTIQFTACDTDPPRDVCPNIELNVVISEANDNDPEFTQDLYRASLSESAPVGTSVVAVQCADNDIGIGALSGYSILQIDPPSNAFRMEANTIFVNSSLDFETTQDHRVMLRCYDSGGKEAFADLTVAVEPVNDNEPVFSQEEYEFTLDKLSLLGNTIGRVEATDIDLIVGGDLTYRLITDDPDLFSLEEDGSITLNSYIFAFEDTQRYNLTIEVSDGESTKLASVVIVSDGPLTVPEIVIIAGVPLIILILLLICCCCCCCCGCCKNWSKNGQTESTDQLATGEKGGQRPGSMLDQGPFYMIAQGPPRTAEGQWEYGDGESMGSDAEVDYGSLPSSSRAYQPSPFLKEMVDYFHEGDKVLDGKKGLKKAKGNK